MKKILFLLLLLPLMVSAQTYKYIGVEDGLSNRRVYYIQKDKKGYMWFLTHEGVDRYDGKEFKRYKLMDDGEELNSLLNLNWLYLDHESTLWEIGKKGKVFRYDPLRDQFTLVYKLPEEKIKDRPAPISCSSSIGITTSGCVTRRLSIYIIPIHYRPSRSRTKSEKTSLISNR